MRKPNKKAQNVSSIHSYSVHQTSTSTGKSIFSSFRNGPTPWYLTPSPNIPESWSSLNEGCLFKSLSAVHIKSYFTIKWSQDKILDLGCQVLLATVQKVIACAEHVTYLVVIILILYHLYFCRYQNLKKESRFGTWLVQVSQAHLSI